MRMHISLFLSLSIAGCALIPSEPDFPWDKKLPCTDKSNVLEDCTSKHVLEAYTQARVYCLKLAKSYEDGGDLVNSSTFLIGGVGTLAGAVLSPLAEGGAKAAWSGLSGSANALQTGINTSFSNSVNARRRAEIANAGTASKDFITRESTASRQVFAAIDMAYDCKMAVGRADAAVAKALNEIQSGAGIRQESPAATIDPARTKEEAEKKAGEAAAKSASEAGDKVAVDSAVVLTTQTEIKHLRDQVAEAAAGAAATVAAAVATETAQKAASDQGRTLSLTQTQTAARIAAQIAAEPIAKAAAEKKAAYILSGKSEEIQKAVRDATAPTAAAAAEAAADAAAGTAAAPAQPTISK